MGHPGPWRTIRTLRHTLVISDVHLCEGVPGDDLWMRWRQNPYFPDTEFAAVVDHLLGGALDPDDRLNLVFNGDLFDFNAGRVIDGKALFEDLPAPSPSPSTSSTASSRTTRATSPPSPGCCAPATG